MHTPRHRPPPHPPPLRSRSRIDPHDWYKVITDDYRAANPIAPQAIANTWTALDTLGQTAAGRQTIATQMKLCSVPANAAEVRSVSGFFQEA